MSEYNLVAYISDEDIAVDVLKIDFLTRVVTLRSPININQVMAMSLDHVLLASVDQPLYRAIEMSVIQFAEASASGNFLRYASPWKDDAMEGHSLRGEPPEPYQGILERLDRLERYLLLDRTSDEGSGAVDRED